LGKGEAFQVKEDIRKDLLCQLFTNIDFDKLNFWVFDFIKRLDFYYFYFIVKITEIIINIDSYQIVQIKFQKWNQEVIMLVYFHFLIFSF
jgi:hypothetical protein